MLINLHDIPVEGKTWTLNRNTSELNDFLKDLIHDQNYEAQVTITPLSQGSGAYQLNGSIRTTLPELCSRCGIDFNLAINEKFNHLLMPALSTPRDAKFAKPNHFSDLHEAELEVVEYSGTVFKAGEFFHEFVALSEPYIPVPPCDEKGNCTVCKISLKDHHFSYDSGEIHTSLPFDALKGIKLN